jgi:hypothetical protein
MPVYQCDLCNLVTSLKTDYKRHLKTKKHLKRLKDLSSKNLNLTSNDFEIKGNDFQLTSNDFEMTSNDFDKKKLDFELTSNDFENPKKTLKNLKGQNLNFNCENSKNLFSCKFCGTSFTRKNNLNTHIKKNRCKKIEVLEDNKDYKKLYEMQQAKINHYESERNQLYKHIDKLLEKVGDTNITQNIMLNCYGKEDLSHISGVFKMALLKIPYGMIPKMIEEVHFSQKCPANKNIYLPNKKEPYVKIFSNDKWVYKDRKTTIKELIDRNYFRLNNFYEENNNILEDVHNKRYIEFKSKKEDSNNLDENIAKDIEIVLLNKN